MIQRTIFTLCSNNYLAHAKTLGDSVVRICPNAHFVIGLVDELHPEIDYSVFSAFEMIKYNEIGCPFFSEMLASYDIIEFNTAIKPFYLEYLLKRSGPDSIVLYIDPDIVLYTEIDDLITVLSQHNVILTPNLTEASKTITTGELISLRHGIYNLGFIGARHTGETMRFLHWWQERLKTHCVIDKPQGLFVDQKWIDLAPVFFMGIHIIYHKGCNMAWWNLSERKLIADLEKYYVNDHSCPLIFFHFSGYSPGEDHFSGRVNHSSYSLSVHSELQEIYKSYSEKIIRNGYAKYSVIKPLLNFGHKKRAEGSGMTDRALRKLKYLRNKTRKFLSGAATN